MTSFVFIVYSKRFVIKQPPSGLLNSSYNFLYHSEPIITTMMKVMVFLFVCRFKGNDSGELIFFEKSYIILNQS